MLLEPFVVRLLSRPAIQSRRECSNLRSRAGRIGSRYSSQELTIRPAALTKITLPGAFLVCFPAIFLAVYGVTTTDQEDFNIAAPHPLQNLLPPARQFLYSSPLIFFLGRAAVGLVRPGLAFWVVILLGQALLAIAVGAYARGCTRKLDFLSCLYATPLPIILCLWLGKGDPYLLAGFLAYRGAMRGGHSFWAMLAVVVMVAAHREMGAIMLVLDALLRRQVAPAPVLAFLVTEALVVVYHYGLLDVAPQGRVGYARTHFTDILVANGSTPIVHVLLGFGWFWNHVCRCLARRLDPLVIAAICFCFASAFLTLDFTRVFVICAMPVVLLVHERLYEDPLRRDPVRSEPAGYPFVFLLQAMFINGNTLLDSSLLQHAFGVATQWLAPVLGAPHP